MNVRLARRQPRLVALAALAVLAGVGVAAYRRGRTDSEPAAAVPPAAVATAVACEQGRPAPAADSTRYGYEVKATFPHDPTAFTQGLVYHEGDLFEGTGIYGESSIRFVDLETGAVERRRDLDARYFGEGIALWKDRVLEITWRQSIGFIYDRDTFEPEGEWHYTTEGWGLAHDGRQLLMSDGTNRIGFRDPDTLEETGSVLVTERGRPVACLNELEMVHGELYANVWLTDYIVIIEPETGAVLAWVDLGGLLPVEDHGPDTDVLNGIAYDQAGDRLLVTGKKWPKLFEIDLVPPRTAEFRSHLPLLLDWPRS